MGGFDQLGKGSVDQMRIKGDWYEGYWPYGYGGC